MKLLPLVILAATILTATQASATEISSLASDDGSKVLVLTDDVSDECKAGNVGVMRAVNPPADEGLFCWYVAGEEVIVWRPEGDDAYSFPLSAFKPDITPLLEPIPMPEEVKP